MEKVRYLLKPMDPQLIRLLACIPKGDIAPRKVVDLAKMLEINTRTVHNMISKLVIEYDIPICSRRTTNAGVFIATTEEERAYGLAALKSNARSTNKRISKAENADLKRVYQYEAMYSGIRDERLKQGEQMNLFDEYEEQYM